MQKLRMGLNKTNAAVLRLERWILILLMIVTFVIMIAQVFFRTILGDPIVWSEEFVRHLLVQEVFIGLSYAVGLDAHIEFGYFTEKAKGKLKMALKVLKNLAAIAIMLFLVKDSVLYVISQMSIQSPTMKYMMGWVWIIFPVSAVFVTLHGVTNIVNMSGKGKEE